ncbi:MAG: hypothetical protein ACOCV8_05280, partial [Spirochaetota bacterium]
NELIAEEKNLRSLKRNVWRAGILKVKEAEDLLLSIIGLDDELLDYCVIYALGFCCNNTNKVREELLRIYDNPVNSEMIKRISTEAILKISDDTQKNEFIDNIRNNLPPLIKESLNDTTKPLYEPLKEYLENANYEQFNLLYNLYLINTPPIRTALINILNEAPMKPNYFKQIRHIFKASEYRRDEVIYGIIARRFEKSKAMFDSNSYYPMYHQGRRVSHIKIQEEIKNPDTIYAYSSATRAYLKKRVWRTLKKMGEIGDDDYVDMACGVLSPIKDSDGGRPRTATNVRYQRVQDGQRFRYQRVVNKVYYDTFSTFMAFNHILYENSPRYFLKGKTWSIKAEYKEDDIIPQSREEAFPELWTRNYKKIIPLLKKSECEKVHNFGIKVLKDSKDFIESPATDDIKILLEAPYTVSSKFGYELFDKVYDKKNPDLDLLIILANSTYDIARNRAFKLIEEHKSLIIDKESLLFKLIISQYQDTRQFIRTLLLPVRLNEELSNTLFARLTSYIIVKGSDEKNLSEIDKKQIKDITKLLIEVFLDQCKRLGINIIIDLISNPLMIIQEFGAEILLKHNIYSKNPTDDLIQTLINSKYSNVRELGVKLFGQLPEEELYNKEPTIMNFIVNKDEAIRNGIRPTIKLLAEKNNFCGIKMVDLIIDKLYRIRNEDLKEYLISVLTDDLQNIENIPLKTIKRLLKFNSNKLKELGGKYIRKSKQLDELTINDIIDMANNDVVSVREFSWELCKDKTEMLRQNIGYTVSLLDSKWEDSRNFAFDFIRENFHQNDFTPKALVRICDSVREDVQSFGRELISRYFEDKHGEEYLTKLSEHPSQNVQLYVTNYLDRYASDNPEKLKHLSHYFKSVLCRVNKGKAAKERTLIFLEKEGLKSEESAKIISEILSFVSLSISIVYKARCIDIMTKIKKK